jgi:hypothetical protein
MSLGHNSRNAGSVIPKPRRPSPTSGGGQDVGNRELRRKLEAGTLL